MKRIVLFIGILLLFTAGVMADKNIKGGDAIDPGDITVTAPDPEGWEGCGSPWYVYAYWETVGPVVDDPAHWEQTSHIPDPNPAITKIEAIEGGFKLTIENEYAVHLKKRIFVKIVGTNASAEPSLFSMQGINVDALPPQDTSIGGASGVTTAYDGGNWDIVIRGLIWPQPELVEVIITVPGVSPNLTGAWVSECCNFQSSPEISVPSITTWGAAVLVALILISGLYIIRRRRVIT